MSYLDQAPDPHRRLTAIAGVAAIHAALAAGLLVGLTVSGVAPPIDTWDPFQITPEPLPEPPPPESRPQQEPESIVTAPTPPLQIVPDERVDLVVVDRPVDHPAVVLDPRPAIEPRIEPRPAPSFTPRQARPSNNPARWISNDDYPARALRAEAEGIAGYRLIVGTSGQVSACELTRSTGNAQLDAATCEFIARRARFEPATDETGARTVGSYTGTVRWDIPE